MKTWAEFIHRYGSHYHVTLACGHQLVINADKLKEQQLYVGKVIECEKHPTKDTND